MLQFKTIVATVCGKSTTTEVVLFIDVCNACEAILVWLKAKCRYYKMISFDTNLFMCTAFMWLLYGLDAMAIYSYSTTSCLSRQEYQQVISVFYHHCSYFSRGRTFSYNKSICYGQIASKYSYILKFKYLNTHTIQMK